MPGGGVHRRLVEAAPPREHVVPAEGVDRPRPIRDPVRVAPPHRREAGVEPVRRLDHAAYANVVVGDTLADVTGIIGYDFGTYTFVPLTKPEIRAKRKDDPISVPFKGEGACKDLVVATYNVENLPSNDTARISAVGSEIDSILNNPDILVLNEIQDDDGPKDDGIVSANKTLAGIADAIKNTSYDFAAIDPIDNQDG